MGCVEAMNYEIVLRNVTFKESREYIRAHYPESIDVSPGFRIFDIYLIGMPPVTIGLDGNTVIFPYTKPCHGTFLLKVEDTAEADRLRAWKKAKG